MISERAGGGRLSIGQPAREGRGIDFTGTMFDPMRMTDVKVREELRYENDSTFVMVMYMDKPDGTGEMKTIEYRGTKQ